MTPRTLLVVACVAFLVASVPPAAASHPCIDEPLCQPHEEPHPKELIQALWDRVECLILAQPPTACV